MLYLLGVVALIIIIVGLILFLRRGNKEFEPKLSLRERRELEMALEKQAKEEAEEEVAQKKEKEKVIEIKKPEEVVVKQKPVFPTKDLKAEISRFTTHIDLNNFKVQNSIRNGVENFINLDYKVALEEFSLAIELNPQDAIGYYCRGLTKLQLKNFESAISDFTEAINLKMKEPNPFYYRALAYLYMKDIDNAVLNFRSYITIESHFAEVYYDLGNCFKQKENYAEAIKYFSLAIERDPKDELSYFERGLLRHKMNDIEAGCADLKKALEMGYFEAYDYVTDLCKNKKD